ncbi:MAG: aspartate-semialdehyde dehydrogenase [Thermoleophilia bacterium]
MKTYTVAVAGAMGLVGSTMVQILEEYNFPVNCLKLLETEGLVGKKVQFHGQGVYTELCTPEAFEGVDIALFGTPASVSAEMCPEAARRGAIAIDNSSYFRMNPHIPLIVPEVNPEDISWQKGIIANPNCTTIGTILVLKPIHMVSRIRRLVASTYQATSGAGINGPLELMKQCAEIAAGRDPSPPSVFIYQIAHNVIPLIDALEADGYTKEEWKMVNETHKMLHDDTIRITNTNVRVPVVVGHSVSCNIVTEEKITVEQARAILEKAPGVKVVDDRGHLEFPQPLKVAGCDITHVGRIREDFSTENGLNLFLASDNVRKGAASNAVQIAQLLVREGQVEKWQRKS